MHPHRALVGVLAVLLTGIASQGGRVHASEVEKNTLRPVIPTGQGETCVEDTDFMRRNHMDLLEHGRDETVLNGLRNQQYSLKECLGCHAVYGPDATPVTFASPSHFCRSCHDYAAVSIDCFQCHASRPESGELPADHQVNSAFPATHSHGRSE